MTWKNTSVLAVFQQMFFWSRCNSQKQLAHIFAHPDRSALISLRKVTKIYFYYIYVLLISSIECAARVWVRVGGCEAKIVQHTHKCFRIARNTNRIVLHGGCRAPHTCQRTKMHSAYRSWLGGWYLVRLYVQYVFANQSRTLTQQHFRGGMRHQW